MPPPLHVRAELRGRHPAEHVPFCANIRSCPVIGNALLNMGTSDTVGSAELGVLCEPFMLTRYPEASRSFQVHHNRQIGLQQLPAAFRRCENAVVWLDYCEWDASEQCWTR